MNNLLKFVKPYKKQVILGPIFKLLEAVFEISIPTIMILITDKGIGTKNINYIFEIGLIMLLMAILGVLSSFTCQYFSSFASQGFGTILRNEMFKKIGTFSYNEIDAFGTPSLINRVTNDVNQLQLGLAMVIRLAIRVPFLCIGGIVMAMYLDIKLSLIMYLSIPFFAFAIYLIMNKSLPLYKVVQKKLDKLALILRENLSGVRVIRAFSRVEGEKVRFKESNEELASTAIKVGKISALMNPVTSIIMNFALMAVIWFGGIRVNIGGMTTGKVIAYINYINMVLSALIVLANLIVTFTKAAASAARVNEIFNTDSSIKYEGSSEFNKVTDEAIPVLKFDNVSFAYKGSKEDAISNISFEIKRGQTVGIIGGTGSGKTTLVNLIPRLYDTTKGSILINGVNVRDYYKKELDENVGLVPQKAILFSGTVTENIRWGNETADMSEVKKAAEIGMAADFVEKMPEKYETHISQGGVNFSGGQKQRLTIARALVKKPEILIMDDSLSALDYATDAALRKALRENTEDMTVIMVTQRISTIKDADLIIVLDDGNLAGVGTHEELLKESDVYKEICSSQITKEAM
ncbi:ATP-binding cassette subfamily B protein [Clostridium saccharoperbutylacetonicum]|uniref:ABC-type multidrug transport system, ATPase and permease component n=1 Tax=Clostridium saccharoperbutylacetonicum N1-4(HMT) TaxID=931276 RepID=M1MID2_9CLOT|nr:ABC transporter ATP-binding protein [Clostridium saccharoperbutylacetonicum]AGF57679.1 ABC-type multidrug transport system, ATPase and permease component [Clostridium saccharoperbutylacetonicum N1-4(HMT)]NRT61553.1 ATP-binding cassette subfamily B protein [Clostridium saccharoperbutylacetonicum]NSB24876.1 ATP-binding cassette subfamily B protein [Clostridium saccharoperbutylacetonicum]NSB44247.1 ATP-binding cassette subfamily B protein [Clostridium saccharoperbutylacetonicum]